MVEGVAADPVRKRTRDRILGALDRWLPAAVPAFAVVWFTHVVLTEYGDPLGRRFDFALWVISCALKVAALVALVRLLGAVHAVLSRNRRRTVVAAGVWTGFAAAPVLALAATRAWWAPRLSNNAIKYYSTVRAKYPEPGFAEWLGDWSRGSVLASELALALGLAAICALAGYALGHRRWASLPAAILGSGAALVGYLVWCPWFHLDYDNFHGDIFSAAVAFDGGLFPIAMDPYATIASLFYLAAWAGDLVILRMAQISHAEH
jgi:hypothetical protein